MTQKTDSLQLEFTLTKLGIQLVFSELFQHNSEMLSMLLSTFRVDQYVVYEYHDKPIYLLHKDLIHEGHEKGRGIS